MHPADLPGYLPTQRAPEEQVETPPQRAVRPGSDLVDVWYRGRRYPATPIARGAAYELFTTSPEPGFAANPRPGSTLPYRRFVHATHILPIDAPPPTDPLAPPLSMPASPEWTYAAVHRLSQSAPDLSAPGATALLKMIRRTATISRGTPMIKILSPRQVGTCLAGRPLAGFCHREYDLAHLRTPAELGPLNGSPEIPDDVAFALRWRAIDALDYVIPLARQAAPAAPAEADVTGLSGLPPSDRIGPHVLGTGFTPNGGHLIPEWITNDLADLPLPAGANISAYTGDGTQVVLYTYQPDQHAWLRMCGPQWLRLLDRVRLSGSAKQEYFPISTPPVRLIGRYQGRMVEAIADPPEGFRTAAKSSAAQHPVDALVRRVRYATWRMSRCSVVGGQDGWHRLRLCQPSVDQVERLGAEPVDRGVYEAWAPASELTDSQEIDLSYELG